MSVSCSSLRHSLVINASKAITVGSRGFHLRVTHGVMLVSETNFHALGPNSHVSHKTWVSKTAKKRRSINRYISETTEDKHIEDQ